MRTVFNQNNFQTDIYSAISNQLSRMCEYREAKLLPLFPVYDDGGCTCSLCVFCQAPGRRLLEGFSIGDATRDQDEIASWLRRNPNMDLAIVFDDRPSKVFKLLNHRNDEDELAILTPICLTLYSNTNSEKPEMKPSVAHSCDTWLRS